VAPGHIIPPARQTILGPPRPARPGCSTRAGQARTGEEERSGAGEPHQTPRLATIAYVVTGVIEASQHSYYGHLASLSQVLSALVTPASGPWACSGRPPPRSGQPVRASPAPADPKARSPAHGAVRPHSRVHVSYTRIQRTATERGDTTRRSTARLVPLVGFALSLPLTGKRQAMCTSTSCGFSGTSSLRGGCSARASHQSRSPTSTPPPPNARPASRSFRPVASAPTAALLRTPAPALPHRWVSKSPGETPFSSALAASGCRWHQLGPSM
jgi:hypothetical protein